MFQSLLVPLDGSQLAEASLPAAVYLAQTLDASLMLLHLIERNAPEQVHGEQHLGTLEEAHAYLTALIQRMPGGIRVAEHIHRSGVNDVAHGVVDHAEELAIDLIILCTHGRGGVRSWLFGSIAQQVIALGHTPVLLVDPAASQKSFACRRLLVPLDGEPAHEQGLSMAANLACQYGAELHLLMVVPTRATLSAAEVPAGRLLPGTTDALLAACEDAGASYLDEKVVQLQKTGITVTAEVERGDPAKVIAARAQTRMTDLIVLGTHGKSHMDTFWSSSVTPRVSSQSQIPLLLVPIDASTDTAKGNA